jgi:hypothetical protein
VEGRECVAEALALARKRRHVYLVPTFLMNLGNHAPSDPDAERCYVEALPLMQGLGSVQQMAWCLRGTAARALWRELSTPLATRSVSLVAAAERLLESIAAPRDRDQDYVDAVTLRLREYLGDHSFDLAWATGRALSLEEAVTLATTLPPDRAS